MVGVGPKSRCLYTMAPNTVSIPPEDAFARVDLFGLALLLADTGAFRNAQMIEASMLIAWPELAIAWHDLADSELRDCIEARCKRAIERTQGHDFGDGPSGLNLRRVFCSRRSVFSEPGVARPASQVQPAGARQLGG